MNAFADGLLELLYPSRANCMGCASPLGADEGWLCDECRALLVPIHDLYDERCPRCGRPGRWDKCRACRDWPPGMIALARSVYVYRRPVERMIRRMKYQGVTVLSEWMGMQITRLLAAEAFPRADMVAAVPMHRRRQRVRGFNHAELLARVVARETGLPLCTALRRSRNTRQQARLTGAQRKSNLIGAFVADESVSGRRVLLIDDVLTSGATALHCADALKKSGAADVFVATLACAIK